MIRNFLLLTCLLGADLHAQRSDDFHLRNRVTSPQNEVVSAEDIKQIAKQGATLDAINLRLNAIDDNVKGIRTSLDNDVMPTIHVMDFFKWLLGSIIVAIIGIAFNDWWKNRRTNPA
jgi:hypothetical protein